MSLDELVKKASEKFLYCEEAISTIHLGQTTLKNTILHGPGGYGKTQMAKFVGNLLYKPEEIETVLFGEGTISSYILGGIDMTAMKEDGDILYKPSRSWMSKKFVVFEEFLDALGPTLENLKYILSEGEFPQRGGVFESQVEAIVGCTNRTPATWCKDSASLNALMSRFPFETEVVWPRHEYNDYANLFSKRFNTPMPEVSEACEICHEHKVTRSPRQAINLAEAFKARKSLGVFAFDRDVQNNKACLRAILQAQGKAEYRTVVRETFAFIKEALKELKPANSDNSNDQLEHARYLYNTLLGLRIDEKLAKEYDDLQTQVKRAMQTYEKHAKPKVPVEWLNRAGKQVTVTQPEIVEELFTELGA